MNPLYFTFAIYILLVLGIGFVAYFMTRNYDDYILGGRSLGGFVTAMSAGASDMSGWLLMGLPGAIYLSGLNETWIAIGLVVGAYFNWVLVSGRLRFQTEHSNNALTLPDYFYQRFGCKTPVIKVIAALIILVFFTLYCASGIVAGAKLFQLLFEVDYTTAMWLGAGATIIYTFVGGFLAVSWTDTVQASLMFFALVLTPIMVYLGLGGADEMRAAIESVALSTHKEYDSLFAGTTLLGIISTAAWGLGYFGQPHILARFMAAESKKSLLSARRIGMTWMIICLAGAVAVGYFGIAYYAKAPIHSADAEKIFMKLAVDLFNPWIAGVILSAILAAVMSTLSCQLLVSASAITGDFYKGFIKPNASQKELVWLGRVMVLLIAAIALYIARDPNSSVLKIVSNAWAGFGAAFGPVVILSLFSKRISELGAILGMVTGALVVYFWKDVVGYPIYEIVPGFIACWVVTYVISIVGPAPQEVQDKFDAINRAYHEEA